MNELQVIKGVRTRINDNGIIELNIEDVARGLGFTQTKNGIEYVRWETINSYLKEFGFSQLVGKDDFIPENIFYKLAIKANNPTAVAFQDLITDDILPTIRKTGGYNIDQNHKRNYLLGNIYEGGIKAVESSRELVDLETKDLQDKIVQLEEDISTSKLAEMNYLEEDVKTFCNLFDIEGRFLIGSNGLYQILKDKSHIKWNKQPYSSKSHLFGYRVSENKEFRKISYVTTVKEQGINYVVKMLKEMEQSGELGKYILSKYKAKYEQRLKEQTVYNIQINLNNGTLQTNETK